MVRSVRDWMVLSYGLGSIKKMTSFIDDTALYRDFPNTHLSIVKDPDAGCFGGIVKVNGEATPCVQLSLPYIMEYTRTGYHEYDHIFEDKEIGSIDRVMSWKHAMMTVLCHEVAHAVVMMHEFYKKHGDIPATYHAYSVDSIRASCEPERKHHGVHWQYTYRLLRNEFVNSKTEDHWRKKA